MSCEELSHSAPQLFFANISISKIMCWVLYNLQHEQFDYKKPEIYFDMISMSVSSKLRK